MNTNLFDLSGKVALITGGTHGIGMAIAITLGKAGAKITVNDISGEKLTSCKEEYKKGNDDTVQMLIQAVININGIWIEFHFFQFPLFKIDRNSQSLKCILHTTRTWK